MNENRENYLNDLRKGHNTLVKSEYQIPDYNQDKFDSFLQNEGAPVHDIIDHDDDDAAEYYVELGGSETKSGNPIIFEFDARLAGILDEPTDIVMVDYLTIKRISPDKTTHNEITMHRAAVDRAGMPRVLLELIAELHPLEHPYGFFDPETKLLVRKFK